MKHMVHSVSTLRLNPKNYSPKPGVEMIISFETKIYLGSEIYTYLCYLGIGLKKSLQYRFTFAEKWHQRCMFHTFTLSHYQISTFSHFRALSSAFTTLSCHFDTFTLSHFHTFTHSKFRNLIRFHSLWCNI